MVIDLQGDQKKLENEQMKVKIVQFELEIRQLKERIEMMKTNEEKMIKENQKYTTDLIQDRIHSVQVLQIELSQKDNELVLLNKKIKNLNYTVVLYKEQVEKFNKKK